MNLLILVIIQYSSIKSCEKYLTFTIRFIFFRLSTFLLSILICTISITVYWWLMLLKSIVIFFSSIKTISMFNSLSIVNCLRDNTTITIVIFLNTPIYSTFFSLFNINHRLIIAIISLVNFYVSFVFNNGIKRIIISIQWLWVLNFM